MVDRKVLLCVIVVLFASLFFIWPLSKGDAVPAENSTPEAKKSFTVYPIGQVQKEKGETIIKIDPKYHDALLGLDGFSHVWVIWWFDRNNSPKKRNILRVHPRGNKKNPLTGVFATRSPVRPNLIALTLCKIISINKNIIKIEKTDAFNNTPVLDLKPYIPGYDGNGKATLPKWIGRR